MIVCLLLQFETRIPIIYVSILYKTKGIIFAAMTSSNTSSSSTINNKHYMYAELPQVHHNNFPKAIKPLKVCLEYIILPTFKFICRCYDSFPTEIHFWCIICKIQSTIQQQTSVNSRLGNFYMHMYRMHLSKYQISRCIIKMSMTYAMNQKCNKVQSTLRWMNFAYNEKTQSPDIILLIS